MDLQKNADRFSGKDNVRLYDTYRPQPPAALVDLALSYMKEQSIHLVDLGCGSGLSSMVWINLVDQLTCVDPGTDMLSSAREKFKNVKQKVNFIQAFAHEIPLEDLSVDIVTISQAFHWMDPKSSLDEINRILKPGGMLLIYDCYWPPSINMKWEKAFIKLFDHVKSISDAQTEPLMRFWNKAKHKSNIEKSGHFSFVKQIGFHKCVLANYLYFIGIAESQGGIQALRKIGLTDDEIGWSEFVQCITKTTTDENLKFSLHYSAIFAHKV